MRWKRPGPGSPASSKAGTPTGPNGCLSIRWEAGGRSKPTGSLKARDGVGERSDGNDRAGAGRSIGRSQVPTASDSRHRHRRDRHQGRHVDHDADVQGYGVISGEGVELVITLGTGFGSGLFVDGKLVPNLEIGHHPFQKGKTYEDLLGDAALKKVGKRKWNKRVVRAIQTLERTFNYDRLYVGGGNAARITVKLPSNVKIVSNVAGLLGRLALLRD